MRFIDDIPVWGEPDPGALAQIRVCARFADLVALMADNHKGYGVPIGGVMASREYVSPTGVGYDIGCGNKAVLTDMPAAEAGEHIDAIMDDIWRTISFGVGRKNAESVDHELFDDDAWQLPAVAALRDKAAAQLGTVGSGNHYVDIFADEQDRVWIGVHFGSRGFGHGVATHYLAAGGAKDGMDVEPLMLPATGELGAEYIAAMKLAGRYAYAGRDWVCQRVADLLGAEVLDEVHNHHNFAWREHHGADDYWVVRKGATPAFPGQRGFVGGTMGDISVILEGSEPDRSRWDNLADQDYALFSTVHGAGRVMSRTAAAGKSKRRFVQDPDAQAEQRDLERRVKGMAKGSARRAETGARIAQLAKDGYWDETVIKPGAVSREAMADWLTRERVVLRGGGLDEAPQAYRRLPAVLAEHADTVRILHELRPLGVAMAGADEFDPYKD